MLNLEDAAKKLSIDTNSLKKLVLSKKINCYYVNGKMFFEERDLNILLAQIKIGLLNTQK